MNEPKTEKIKQKWIPSIAFTKYLPEVYRLSMKLTPHYLTITQTIREKHFRRHKHL